MSCDFCEVFYWASIPVAWLALGMTIAAKLRERRERERDEERRACAKISKDSEKQADKSPSDFQRGYCEASHDIAAAITARGEATERKSSQYVAVAHSCDIPGCISCGNPERGTCPCCDGNGYCFDVAEGDFVPCQCCEGQGEV